MWPQVYIRTSFLCLICVNPIREKSLNCLDTLLRTHCLEQCGHLYPGKQVSEHSVFIIHFYKSFLVISLLDVLQSNYPNSHIPQAMNTTLITTSVCTVWRVKFIYSHNLLFWNYIFLIEGSIVCIAKALRWLNLMKRDWDTGSKY